jgi:predicted ATPase
LNNLTGEIEKVSIKLSKIPGSFIISIFSKDDKEFDVDEISDGLKYFICILAILHQPNPPKVILLEEPENGIHPRRIIEIYRLITKLAEEKDVQFFITTHSPILLNLFSEDPECVWVFDKVDGISQIKNLKFDILDPRTKHLKEMGVEDPGDLTDDLGENWLLGLIDGVPPGIVPEDF